MGFEPTVPEGTHALQARALGRTMLPLHHRLSLRRRELYQTQRVLKSTFSILMQLFTPLVVYLNGGKHDWTGKEKSALAAGSLLAGLAVGRLDHRSHRQADRCDPGTGFDDRWRIAFIDGGRRNHRRPPHHLRVHAHRPQPFLIHPITTLETLGAVSLI